jgi:hypothetical protein
MSHRKSRTLPLIVTVALTKNNAMTAAIASRSIEAAVNEQPK